MEISHEIFAQQRYRKYGSTNPERIEFALWHSLVRSGLTPYQLLNKYNARVTPKAPDWCFTRDGMSSNVTQDGRTIYIGGEYEDTSDPEFCIFNDVIVSEPNKEIAIYGYPKDLFPPTDFHSATLIENRIIIIGSLGYSDRRIAGHTPVFALDLSTYQIEKLETKGQNPGWIFRQVAHLCQPNAIQLEGGKVCTPVGLRRNFNQFTLDIETLTWQQLTNRDWKQFRITFFDQIGNPTYPEPLFDPNLCIPSHLPYKELDGWGYQINIDQVPITLWDENSSILITIEGELSHTSLSAFLEDTMRSIKGAVKTECVLEEPG